MNSIGKKTIGFVAVALFLMLGPANAQRHFRTHFHTHYLHFPHTITVVNRPATTVRISNRFSQEERLQMAVAYLSSNANLSIKKYAKMTGLSRDMAEAELDAFAYDDQNPIKLDGDGMSKKKMYTIR